MTMRRRDFIAGLGGAVAWPLAAWAQRGAVPVVGILSARTMESDASLLATLRKSLSEIGFFDGSNVAFDYRFADYRLERLPALAADLVSRQAAVIFAVPTPAAAAAKAATKSIPIVFILGVDPVQTGLVASLARPGGNVTGISNLNAAVAAKRLELLHVLLPAETSFAYLSNPTNLAFTTAETRELQVAAQALGTRLLIVNSSVPSDFEVAFATVVKERAGGLVVSGESLFISNLARLAVLGVRYRVPTIYPDRAALAAGGLMSYGSGDDTIRRAAAYIGRILKGEKPADLPVQQTTKFELVINLMTAKALGLTVTPDVLSIADEVIE